MSYPALVFPAKVTRDRVHAAESYIANAWANSQQGLRPTIAIPDDENAGSFDLSASHVHAEINYLVEIVTDGEIGTSTYRVSLDGGTTWYGRTTDWLDSQLVGPSPSLDGFSNVEIVPDRNNSNIPHAIMAVKNASTHVISIYHTTHAARPGYDAFFSSYAANIFAADANTIGMKLKLRKKVLWLFYQIAAGIYCRKSTDYGLTWGAAIAVATDADESISSHFDVAYCPRIDRYVVVYTKSDGTYHQVYGRVGVGSTWSGAKKITDGTANSKHPTICQQGLTTHVVFLKTGTGLNARKTTATNPCAGSAVWADNNTLFYGISANDNYPAILTTTTGKLMMAWLNLGTVLVGIEEGGTFAANETAGTESGAPAMHICNVRGSIMVIGAKGHWSRTWKAEGANVSPSWTSHEAQVVPNAIGYAPFTMLRLSAGEGAAGDRWTVTTEYEWSKEEAWALRFSRASRATSGAYAYHNELDAGANNFFRVDTALLRANVDAATFESSADDFATHTDTALSFVRRTLASCTFPGGGKIVKTGAGMTPDAHRGEWAMNGTTSYLIAGNSADTLFVDDADLSGLSGDVKILARLAWATLTESATRYARFACAAQTTADGYVEFSGALIGCRMELPNGAAIERTVQPLDSYQTPGLDSYGRKAGERKRVFKLILAALSIPQQDQLRAALDALAGVPFAIIPDMADTHDYALVMPDGPIDWDQDQSVVTLVEV